MSKQEEAAVTRQKSGPRLLLLYSLLALALASAIGFALLIVFPFYRHSH
ncbi:MAG: hypothetical protein P4L03_02030 [Terracidiphilus sp.]|nr:hypothetical protein [Terracidiphilus sp.]